MNTQTFIISEKEKIAKKKAMEALTPVEAMPLEKVPEIFHNPKDKTPQIIKQKKEWIFAHLQNTFPDSPVGKIIISRSGETGYVGIVIRVDKDGKKYYSHTIYKKISRAATGGTENQNLTRNLHPAVNNILHEILSVNS